MGCGFRSGSLLRTAAGDISISGRGGKTYGNARGIVSNNTNLQVLSESGTITFTDTKPTGNTSYGGLYLKPSSANAILFGADGSTVSSSSSDVVIQADRVTFDGTTTRMNSSGELSIEPLSASFGVPLLTRISTWKVRLLV